jgi:hypothetical protein
MGTGWHTRGVPACGPWPRERRDCPQQPRQDVGWARRKSTLPHRKKILAKAGRVPDPRGARPGAPGWARRRGRAFLLRSGRRAWPRRHRAGGRARRRPLSAPTRRSSSPTRWCRAVFSVCSRASVVAVASARACRQRAIRHRGEQTRCGRRPVRGRPQTPRSEVGRLTYVTGRVVRLGSNGCAEGVRSTTGGGSRRILDRLGSRDSAQGPLPFRCHCRG